MGAKLALDEDGLAVLANAILLAYLARMLRRLDGIPHYAETLLDRSSERREASERTALRDNLARLGCYDRRIEGPPFDDPVNPLGATYARWRNLLNGDADLVTLRAADLDLPEGDSLREIITTLPLYDRRTPFVILGPTDWVRRMVPVVLGRLEADETCLATETPAHGGGPRSGREVKFEDRLPQVIEIAAQSFPGARIKRNDFSVAMKLVGLQSEKAVARVWENVSKEIRARIGSPPADQEHMTAEDLADAIRTALANQTPPVSQT